MNNFCRVPNHCKFQIQTLKFPSKCILNNIMSSVKGEISMMFAIQAMVSQPILQTPTQAIQLSILGEGRGNP